MAVKINGVVIETPQPLDRRTAIWKWLRLSQQQPSISLCDLNSPELGSKMTKLVFQHDLIKDIDTWKTNGMLSEHILSWIEKKGRQPAFLLRHAETFLLSSPSFRE